MAKTGGNLSKKPEKNPKKDEKDEFGLTDKQAMFCHQYCIDFNGTQAALRCGYAAKSARTTASLLLTYPNIIHKINHLKANLAEAAGVSALAIFGEHKKIAFLDPSRIWKALKSKSGLDGLSKQELSCIQECNYTLTTRRDGTVEENTKIKLYSKQTSLDSMGRMIGADAPKENAVTIKSISVQVADQVVADQINKL